MRRLAAVLRTSSAGLVGDWVERMHAPMARHGLYRMLTWSGPQVTMSIGGRPEDHAATVTAHGELRVILDGDLFERETLSHALNLPQGVEHSDEALIAAAYRRWGTDCLTRLSGEFVFALWDPATAHLLVGRDAIGTRHCYYSQGPGWVAVASDVRALLALPGRAHAINSGRLLECLVSEYDRDNLTETCFQDIQRLPAGHWLMACPQDIRVNRYWHPERIQKERITSWSECAERFISGLNQAVSDRLARYPDAAAMLSGGLDSTTVALLAARTLRQNGQSPFPTYTVSQANLRPCPDSAAVQDVLHAWPDLYSHWLTDAHLTPLIDGFGDMAVSQAEPFTVTDGIAYRMAYQAAASHGQRAVFDGMAGDTLFFGFGYPVPEWSWLQRMQHAAAMWSAMNRHGLLRHNWPTAVRSCVPDWVIGHGMRALWRRWHPHPNAADPMLRMLKPSARELLNSRHQPHPPQSSLRTSHVDHGQRFLAGTISFAHERNNQLAADVGITPLSPMSDRRVVELAIALPPEFKLANHWYKRLLRDATQGLLPEAVRWRNGFAQHPGHALYPHWARSVLRLAGAHAMQASQETLSTWIDADALGKAWTAGLERGDDADLDAAFVCYGTSQWLQAQPQP